MDLTEATTTIVQTCIEKGMLKLDINVYDDYDACSQSNEFNAQEIAKFYNTVYGAVYKSRTTCGTYNDQ